MFKRSLIRATIILALWACTRAKQAPARVPQASDSLFTAKAALKIYGTQPEQAIAIIDSALVVGIHQPDGVMIDEVVVALLAIDDDALQRVVADDGDTAGMVDDEGVGLRSDAAK